MKKSIPKFLLVIFLGSFFLYGCSASEVTEEYGEEQKGVVYKTEDAVKKVETPVEAEKSPVVSTQPEYIPQGPPTPPPPPIKVTLEGERPVERTTPEPTYTSPQYFYKVQVFAFKSRLNAETEANKIRKRIPDQQVFIEFLDNLYKVRLGTYSKWEHAKGIKDVLYNLGYTDSFIVTEVK